ncbi:right-handed parallel beta-helix repeat-containing protein [Sphingomonas cannabina]|uniref:parallel beta-helix domain-containing protein n=1 Tax=Sphingomonas cannabina TaxID=2899123 RepID=UPI001F1E580E|nr:parallel beta-helix domain-containing protein [Sphingomonas cannabina]UIJ46753.1 right-handed parallel beta-helix repeat-containing protein [Sphingomonas cannabina]
MTRRMGLLGCAAALALAGCGGPKTDAEGFTIDPDFEKNLQARLLDAKPGTVIDLPAGKYALSRSLSLTANGVTLRGKGMDKTILSFARATSGAEGLLVTGDDFTLEDLALEDTKGDALKINGTKNAVMRRVRAEWTRGPNAGNGAYGLYPVQVTNVLVEGVVVKGASDAGIYVGQSNNIIVRDSRAEGNVAGIEIENSSNADVYGNTATGNTGGILVFNMPNLPVPGSKTRVFKNQVVANNHANFGAKGSAVSSVPAGSGVIVNSNDEVEIFDNDIKDNGTANVIISSYYSTGFDTKGGIAKAYDPFPERIYVTGNRFSGGGDKPGSPQLAPLAALGGGRITDVLWDGFTNPKVADPQICVQNGAAKVLNADGPSKYAKARIDTQRNCAPATRLPAVTLPAAMAKDSGKAS